MPSALFLNHIYKMVAKNSDLLSFICYKYSTSLKNLLSLAHSESLPNWCSGKFCHLVCFDLQVGRIFFDCSR